MTATSFITDYLWRRVPSSTRLQVLAVLYRRDVVGRYVCNVQSDLRALGRHDLAALLTAGRS